MSEKHYYLAIFVLAAIFAAIYSWLSFVSGPPVGGRIFNSPDETANFYFTKLFAESGQLAVENPLPVDLGPRAMRAEGGRLSPGIFLGIILLYGAIAKVFGSWIIIYLTPLFSFFGVLFF